ncbi:MAG TPA: AAA family ATPase [Burkholderiales bacterium]|nr:AAA family ATPase [Burkholderiales bacterium]
MRLIEREDALDRLAEAYGAANAGDGRLLLLAGEAGIGKTSVARYFASSEAKAARAAWGWCDPLSAPRPLAPFCDIMQDLRGRSQASSSTASVPDFLPALLDAVRSEDRPVLMIVEDAHWADEASLELLRLIGRRIHTLPALLVVTFRDDEIGPVHPLRRVLGGLATTLAVSQVPLSPLSQEGVRRLAADVPVDVEALHRQTGGNPFFTTEVLASGGAADIPRAVGDIVFERMARLAPSARALIEVATVLGRAEGVVLRRISPSAAAEAEACIAVGLLRGSAADVTFRHELVRQAILETLSPPRAAELHAQILQALTEAAEHDTARLAHHAEGAGDGGAVVKYAAAAARHAASVGSHREAAFQFARALRFMQNQPPEERAALLCEHAHECAALDRLDEAVARFGEAAATWRALRRPREEATCWSVSALPLVRAGRNVEADERCRRAIAVLEEEGASRELAQALRTQAQLRMLDRDKAQALHYGRRALAMAQALDDREILAAANMTVGTALLVADEAEGRIHLDRAIRLARENGYHDLVAHAQLNLGSSYGEQYHLPAAERFLREGIAFAAERDLDQHLHYMQAWLALTLLYRGQLKQASETALQLLSEHQVAPVSRIMALAALGRTRARRGEPGAGDALDEALELALPTGTLQRVAPVRLARAEGAWLAGNPALAQAEAGAVHDLAQAHRHKWHAAEVAFWRRRCPVAIDAASWFARPFALQLQGQWREAAEAWQTLGCPYEEARARGGRRDRAAGRPRCLRRVGCATCRRRAASEHAAGRHPAPAARPSLRYAGAPAWSHRQPVGGDGVGRRRTHQLRDRAAP